MSLWAACIWALLRGLAVVFLGLPVCVQLQKRLSRATGWEQSIAWLILLLPLIAPPLITGYGFANFSLSLIHHPIWNELLYDLLLLISSVPVGVVLLHFAPPAPISRAAIHCARLSSPRAATHQRPGNMTLKMRLGIWLRGPVRNLIPAGALMFLIAFQEFEIGSMMLIPTWTVWLFDAQAGGLSITHSLQYAALPVSLEMILLIPAVIIFWQSHWLAPRPGHAAGCPFRLDWLWVYLALSTSLYCFIPWSLVLYDSWEGYSALMTNRTLSGDVLRGLMMAMATSTCVYGVVFWLLTLKSNATMRRIVLPMSLFAAITGLMGALSVSLVVLTIFQYPAVHRLYDTPLPWLFGLVWFLAPRAWLMILVLIGVQRREPYFLATLLTRSSQTYQRLAGQQLIWENQWKRHFWGMVLICTWAYLDGTIAALLAPAAWISSPVRLYNLMHYGQSSVLSAMVVVTFGFPLICLALFLCIRRPLAKVLLR